MFMGVIVFGMPEALKPTTTPASASKSLTPEVDKTLVLILRDHDL